MKTQKKKSVGTVMALTVLAAMGFLAPTSLFAHCDTLDGPVAVEAQTALDKGDVTGVLKWVRPSDEAEIKAAFKQSLEVRTKGPEAKKLADTYFLETLVRIHRAGEGQPYTGLKPAGTVEPSIAAADKAMGEGSADELAEHIGKAAAEGVKTRFETLKQTQETKNESVEAGREYVKAYIEYIHFVEGLHKMTTGRVHEDSTDQSAQHEAAIEHKH